MKNIIQDLDSGVLQKIQDVIGEEKKRQLGYRSISGAYVTVEKLLSVEDRGDSFIVIADIHSGVQDDTRNDTYDEEWTVNISKK
ncbi:hypothetical protein CEE45_17310 [Candidatus Heimdallarchaeota archaeon B3_Heim]|nr:MAG: hypothetical protein CEE45_17310 [Candidatus Heimdallarchaeota archaeon B3_Heim]